MLHCFRHGLYPIAVSSDELGECAGEERCVADEIHERRPSEEDKKTPGDFVTALAQLIRLNLESYERYTPR